MSMKPANLVDKLHKRFSDKGKTFDIPLYLWINEFIAETGYTHKKVKYWTKIMCELNLISFENNIINFEPNLWELSKIEQKNTS